MTQPQRNPGRQLQRNTLRFAPSLPVTHASGPDVDLPGSEADPVAGVEATKGHREADPSLSRFNKRKLPMDKAAKLRHNYDAECKGGGNAFPSKLLMLKRHLVDCQKATPYSQ